MIELAGLAVDRRDGVRRATRALEAGYGLERFRRMVEAQRGDPRAVDDPSLLAGARRSDELRAQRSGLVCDIDARDVGEAAACLGTGRGRLGAEVDPGAGLWLRVDLGDRVEEGDVIADLRGADGARLADGRERLERSIRIGDGPPSTRAADPLLEILAAAP